MEPDLDGKKLEKLIKLGLLRNYSIKKYLFLLFSDGNCYQDLKRHTKNTYSMRLGEMFVQRIILHVY